MAANEPGQPALTADASFTHNLAVPATALAIGAHPDDVEFGCGATLAKWADGGCVVHHLDLHRRIEGHVGCPTPTSPRSPPNASTSSARRRAD